MVYFMLEKTNIRIMFVIKNNTIMGYVRQNIFTNTNNYFFETVIIIIYRQIFI